MFRSSSLRLGFSSLFFPVLLVFLSFACRSPALAFLSRSFGLAFHELAFGSFSAFLIAFPRPFAALLFVFCAFSSCQFFRNCSSRMLSHSLLLPGSLPRLWFPLSASLLPLLRSSLFLRVLLFLPRDFLLPWALALACLPPPSASGTCFCFLRSLVCAPPFPLLAPSRLLGSVELVRFAESFLLPMGAVSTSLPLSFSRPFAPFSLVVIRPGLGGCSPHAFVLSLGCVCRGAAAPSSLLQFRACGLFGCGPGSGAFCGCS